MLKTLFDSSFLLIVVQMRAATINALIVMVSSPTVSPFSFDRMFVFTRNHI